ncbi:TATA-box-binding protein [Entamoeba marina]
MRGSQLSTFLEGNFPSNFQPIASCGSIISEMDSMITETDDVILEYPNGTLPRIFNVVSVFQVNTQINLKDLVQKARNVEYNPKRFPAVFMRISSPKSTATIFKNGKINCAGCRSINDSKIACKKFAKIIKKLGYQVRFTNFRVTNIVAVFNVNFKISLAKLYSNTDNEDVCSYDPEVFPGLIYKLEQPKVTLLVYSSGNVVITGAKDEESINKTYNVMYPIILNNKKR